MTTSKDVTNAQQPAAPKAAPAAKAPKVPVEQTGPQSVIVVGTHDEVHTVIGELRDHGSSMKLANGSVAVGPIAARSVVNLEDGKVECRIQLADPIVEA